MNKEEAQILHGLYYFREIVGEEFQVSSNEIIWLATTSISQGKKWRGKDGKRQQREIKRDDWLSTINATAYMAERALSYLEAAGYITSKKTDSNFRVAVTVLGADRARELDSRLGRLNVLYKNHKDGLLWFLATIVVSTITAWITAHIGK